MPIHARWRDQCKSCGAPVLAECPDCGSRAWVKATGPDIACAACSFEWACAGCIGLRPRSGKWDDGADDGIAAA